jgi:hypothetical protein
VYTVAVSNKSFDFSSMRIGRRQIIPLALLTGLLPQIACLHKREIRATSDAFRFQAVRDDVLLMPPPLSESQPANKPIKIRSEIFSFSPDHRPECRADVGAFKIEPQPGSTWVQIEMPPPDQWMEDLEGRSEAGTHDDFESLSRLLNEIAELQKRQCFSSETAGMLRAFLIQALPRRPGEVPLMSYSRFGGLNLYPGMRLKIERAYFKGESHDLKDFLGVSANYFDFESVDPDRVQIRQVGDSQYSSAAVAAAAEDDLRDIALRSISAPMSYRLLFFNYVVPQEKGISAAIIGAPTNDQLNALEANVKPEPESACKEIGINSDSLCIRFEGSVTVSPQISVTVNGKARFVDWGIKLKNVLPDRSETKELRRLRIRRKFMNQLYDIIFDRRDPNILSLCLLEGDDLTW